MAEKKREIDTEQNRVASGVKGDSGAPVVPEESDEPRIVYRRADVSETNAQSQASTLPSRSVWLREISPAIMPLIVGFLSLLILIAVLGLLSMRRMNEVGV